MFEVATRQLVKFCVSMMMAKYRQGWMSQVVQSEVLNYLLLHHHLFTNRLDKAQLQPLQPL